MIPTAAHVKSGGNCPSSAGAAAAVTPSPTIGLWDRELFVQPLRAEVERGSRVRHRVCLSPKWCFWDDNRGSESVTSKKVCHGAQRERGDNVRKGWNERTMEG